MKKSIKVFHILSVLVVATGVTVMASGTASGMADGAMLVIIGGLLYACTRMWLYLIKE